MSQAKLKTLACALAGVFAVHPQAYAANKAEVLETGTVEVVSTTPLPGVGTSIDQVPANVQAASSKAIAEQHNLDVSEFIDANLGSVTINNTVANPYQADVYFRGFTASPLLGTPQGLSVFMDGVRVNEPFGDIVNWDLIPSNAIASINLIPGSNPLFGLNTLGGALSVNTKSGSDFPGLAVTATGGSWGRRALEAEYGGKQGNVDYYFAGNAFHEDGWRDHSPSDVNQLFGKLGWQNDTSDLDLSVMLADTDLNGTQALPLSMWNKRRQAYSWPDNIGNNLEMVTLKGSHFLAEDKLVAADAYYRANRIVGFNSNLVGDLAGRLEARNIASTTDQDGFGGTVQLTLLGDLGGHHNQFTAGASADMGRVDFRSDTQQAIVTAERRTVADPANSRFVPMVRLKTRNDYYGLYATDTFSFNDMLHLTLSGRYNVAKIKLSGANLDAGTDLGGNHRYSRFNPAIGLNFNPSKAIGFYGAYNEGMRAATPVELSCADKNNPCALPNAFLADPHLQMVVSRTWEGGARGSLGYGLGWNMALYRTENDNDILFITTSGAANGFFNNVGETRRQGLELGLNGKLEKFSFAANYGFTDATFQSQFTSISAANSAAGFDCSGAVAADTICVHKGNRIPGIPRHTFKLRLGYEIIPGWSVGSNIVTASGQYARGDENNRDRSGKVPGYTVVHLDTRYSVNENWKLFARINNIFDREYSTFGMIGANAFAPGASVADQNTWVPEQFRSPAAPRAAWVGVTYEFGKPKGAAGAAKPDND